MAVWKKVVVSGSQAELATLRVDNLINGVVTGSANGTLSTVAINGTGPIVATTGSTVIMSGSFSGSFQGSLTGTASFASNAGTASYVSSSNVYGPNGANTILSASFAQTASFALASAASNPLTNGEGISTFSYNGSQVGITVSVSGAADLTQNSITKWDNNANKFATSSLTDDGTNITGTTSIQLTGANSRLSGSFSGSFQGTVNATASWATNAVTASFVTASGVYGPYGSNSVLSSSFALSSSFSAKAGSTVGTLTAGNGITGTAFDGSANQTWSIGAGALINVDADNVYVVTSSLTTNQIPKYVANGLSGSNISDNGTTITLASATNVSAGGLTVTGNSTFNNNLTVAGDLTVAGTASFQNTQNLLIGDRFAALASGSQTLTDGGIIVISSTSAAGMSGSAWYLEAGNGTDNGPYGRWATAFNVHASASAATVSEYAVTVAVSANSTPSAAPTWGGATNGSGNMWVKSDTGDIYIYA